MKAVRARKRLGYREWIRRRVMDVKERREMNGGVGG